MKVVLTRPEIAEAVATLVAGRLGMDPAATKAIVRFESNGLGGLVAEVTLEPYEHDRKSTAVSGGEGERG